MRILSFGEIIWDLYPDGSRHIGGAPLNFAAHAAACGAASQLWSAVGEDLLGREAVPHLEQLGVDASTVFFLENASTGVCRVALNKEGIPTYRVMEDTAYDRIPLPPDADWRRFDAIAYGTLALRGEHNRAVLEQALSAASVDTVFCDLNLRPPFDTAEAVDICLSHATLLKVSEGEWAYLKERFSVPSGTLAEQAHFFATYAPRMRILLVTCGENGAFCVDVEEGTAIFEPAHPAEVVSTVGAGDSFGAAFLCAYLRGDPLESCMYQAAARSALVVAQEGAVL